MKYDIARPLIKSGDLLAFTHRGWSSWYDIQLQMVRAFTQSEYSHVGIAWVAGGRVFIIESVLSGIRIFPASRAIPFYWIGLNANWTSGTEEFALRHIGEPYSKVEAIRSFFEPLQNNGQWQCAKWAAAILNQMGIDLGSRATPTDIVRQALKRDSVSLILVEA